MGLNTRGIYHPRFTQQIARVDEGSMTGIVTVLRKSAGEAGWDYDLGKPTAGGAYEPIAHTRARITAAASWSAQGYLFGDQTTVFQAVKFNVPATLSAEAWLLGDDEPVEFRDEDRIVIDKLFFPNLDPLKPFVYTVRNVLISDTDAQWTLVTDANLKVKRGES